MLFHVLNRGVGRMRIFRARKDYDAFERVVEQTLSVAPISAGRVASHAPPQTTGTIAMEKTYRAIMAFQDPCG
jgi:hypothetical protein